MNLNSLEDVVTAATTVTDLAALVQALKNLLKRDLAEQLLASKLANDEDPLALLDPRSNTLGYLYILAARLEQATAGPTLAAQIFSFCENFDSNQTAYVPERVNAFAVRLARQPNISDLLPAFATFVTRYPFARDVFTAVHPIFLGTCLRVRQYEYAIPVLSVPMAQIDKSIYPITYLDNLLYHYYGAFIFISLKSWPEAEEYLEMVVSAPLSSSVPSAIQLEAMKKLSLVQLIRYGSLKNLPKYVPQLFSKAVKQSPYGTLAKVYPSGQVQQVVEKDTKTWQADYNLGLVREVLENAPRWKLRTLTKTYLTLSLAEIGKEIGLEHPETLRSLVEDMIRVGDITANLENDTLSFIDEKPSFRPEDVERALAAAQSSCHELQQLDMQVGRSKEFLQKALKDRESGGAGVWGMGDDAEMAMWTEDIVAGGAYV